MQIPSISHGSNDSFGVRRPHHWNVISREDALLTYLQVTKLSSIPMLYSSGLLLFGVRRPHHWNVISREDALLTYLQVTKLSSIPMLYSSGLLLPLVRCNNFRMSLKTVQTCRFGAVQCNLDNCKHAILMHMSVWCCNLDFIHFHLIS